MTTAAQPGEHPRNYAVIVTYEGDDHLLCTATTREEALAPVHLTFVNGSRGWGKAGAPYRVLADVDSLAGGDPAVLLEALRTDPALRAIYETGWAAGKAAGRAEALAGHP